MKKFSQFMQEAKLEMRGSSHGLAKMSASELEQEHKKVQGRIDALGSNVPSSLTQRATLIKLHMKMRNEEAEQIDEGIVSSVKKGIKNVKRGLKGWGTFEKDSPKELVKRNKAYDDSTVKLLHKGGPVTKGSPADLQKRVLDREMKKRNLGEEEAEQIDEISKETAQSYLKKTVDPVEGMPRDNFKNLKTRLKGIARASKIVTKPEK